MNRGEKDQYLEVLACLARHLEGLRAQVEKFQKILGMMRTEEELVRK